MNFYVKLNTINNAKEFVNVASTFKEDVFVQSGNYQVDGKSIMGLFSLNLESPVKVVTDIDEDTAKKAFKQFM